MKRYSIGDLSRRSGLPVRTIRFWSDADVLPPAGRTTTGHRWYDEAAATRLDLIRTLREIGLELALIRRVLGAELTVARAAALHADTLDAQIRTLRLRRAVLRRAATRDSGPREIEIMHHIAQLTAAERHRLVDGFIDSVFGDVDANPALVAMLRQSLPDLPAEPTADQMEAWIELAELVRDPDFRAAVRRMAEHQAADRAAGDRTGLHHDLTTTVRDRVTAAVDTGIPADSPAAAPIVTELVARYADTFGTTDSPGYRSRLLHRLETAADPRAERYWHLIAVVNGWPTPPSLTPVFTWFIAAIRHHDRP